MIKWNDYLLFFPLKKHCQNLIQQWMQVTQIPKIYYVSIKLPDDTKNNILLLGLHIDAHFSPRTTQIMISPNLTVTLSHTKYSKVNQNILWHKTSTKLEV